MHQNALKRFIIFKANQRIGLTGTLITNSAVDVYGQFLAVGYGNELT